MKTNPISQPVWLAAAVAGAVSVILGSIATARAAAEPPPNVILILCDNLGYGDLGCFGSQVHRTPHVDRMAAEGMRFTHFYASSGVCTPSRASIMTGCYPLRVSMHVSDRGGAVLQPMAQKGLHPDEITVAEVLKKQSYATAIIGKWHLGDQPQFLPLRQGFDHYLGIPYSDDMTDRPGQPWPPLPLMRNDRVIEAPVDRDYLTERYTREAIDFITAHRGQPFFIYLAHAMPGSTGHPFSSPKFRGRSANGDWGDSVEEIDSSTGEILAALKRLDLDRRTFVVWTSDNGAPRRNPPQGSNRPLSGWGYSTAEGGMRVPCVMRWPGRIPSGTTCAELTTTMDLLPTFARLAGTQPPQDRTIDGRDMGPLMTAEPGARSPHEAFFYYHMNQLQAVRSGPWKLYLPLEKRLQQGRGQPDKQEAALYDLVADVAEEHNLCQQKPEVVARLLTLAERAREDLGDLNRPGKHTRPAGHEPHPTPRVIK